MHHVSNAFQKQRFFQVLHFGDQCPWRLWVVEQAKRAAAESGGIWEALDISSRPELAARHGIFFPTVTVIDNEIRIPSPTPASRLLQIIDDQKPNAPFDEKPQADEGRAEKVIPLTADNISDTCRLCIPPSESGGCQAKQAWARSISPKIPDGFLGFAACQGEEIVGAVEYLPSLLIPYPIPEKSPSIAFITCIYSQEDKGDVLDYRSQALAYLLGYLPTRGFCFVQVVAGLHTAYPNGPKQFFTDRGFEEINTLGTFILGESEETLVLMEKSV
ncbi:MAG: hypothetical protein GYA34_09490 [Chloroflexi bacterium]|nr:hypothetical protein [Chloroflexota bacterium]